MQTALHFTKLYGVCNYFFMRALLSLTNATRRYSTFCCVVFQFHFFLPQKRSEWHEVFWNGQKRPCNLIFLVVVERKRLNRIDNNAAPFSKLKLRFYVSIVVLWILEMPSEWRGVEQYQSKYFNHVPVPCRIMEGFVLPLLMKSLAIWNSVTASCVPSIRRHATIRPCMCCAF